MPTAIAAIVRNFIIDQTPGLIFLRSAYEAGGGAHRPRPAWSSAPPLPICRQPAVAAPPAHYGPQPRKGEMVATDPPLSPRRPVEAGPTPPAPPGPSPAPP